MTITEAQVLAPLITVRYTSEELAVIADLYELESLPGVRPIEMSLDLRSLATRCLIARGVVRMPEGGGVEITQPHATLIAGMFDAPRTVQVSWMQGGVPSLWTWFDLDDNCVRVSDDDEGIVDIAAFTVPVVDAINGTLGITVAGTLTSDAEADVVVELLTTTLRTDLVTTERSIVARVNDTWYTIGED